MIKIHIKFKAMDGEGDPLLGLKSLMFSLLMFILYVIYVKLESILLYIRN
jgi:hypothetical protein